MLHINKLDKKGQWIILSSFILTFVILSIATLYYELISTSSTITFIYKNVPYYEARSLLVELTRAIKNDDINSSSVLAFQNASKIYARRGFLMYCNLSGTDIVKIHMLLISENAEIEVQKNVTKD